MTVPDVLSFRRPRVPYRDRAGMPVALSPERQDLLGVHLFPALRGMSLEPSVVTWHAAAKSTRFLLAEVEEHYRLAHRDATAYLPRVGSQILFGLGYDANRLGRVAYGLCDRSCVTEGDLDLVLDLYDAGFPVPLAHGCMRARARVREVAGFTARFGIDLLAAALLAGCTGADLRAVLDDGVTPTEETFATLVALRTTS